MLSASLNKTLPSFLPGTRRPSMPYWRRRSSTLTSWRSTWRSARVCARCVENTSVYSTTWSALRTACPLKHPRETSWWANYSNNTKNVKNYMNVVRGNYSNNTKNFKNYMNYYNVNNINNNVFTLRLVIK